MSPKRNEPDRPKRNKVADVMSGGTECVGENEPMIEAAKKLAQLDRDALPMCGADGTVSGVITEHDLVSRGLALGKNPNETMVKEVGSAKLVTVGAGDSLESAKKTMNDHNLRALPVMDGGKLVGVISMTDVVALGNTEGLSNVAEGKRN